MTSPQGTSGNLVSYMNSTLQTSNGKNIKRPLEKLYPFEVQDDVIKEQKTQERPNRPKRTAAIEAKCKLKELEK